MRSEDNIEQIKTKQYLSIYSNTTPMDGRKLGKQKCMFVKPTLNAHSFYKTEELPTKN